RDGVGEHLVLLGDAGVAEAGRVAAVRGPGRGAELVEAVVAAGVHDLAVAAGLTGDDARLERAVTRGRDGRRGRCGGRGGDPRGGGVPRAAGRRRGGDRSRGADDRGRGADDRGRPEDRRRGRDLGRLGRDGQYLPDADHVRVPDLLVVGPVEDRPVTRVVVGALRDAAEGVAGLDRVAGPGR